jgi:hypothetical protein
MSIQAAQGHWAWVEGATINEFCKQKQLSTRNHQIMSPTSTSPSVDVIKSDQDKCSYRFTTLEKNGLQVLLIHDPSTDEVSL